MKEKKLCKNQVCQRVAGKIDYWANIYFGGAVKKIKTWLFEKFKMC